MDHDRPQHMAPKSPLRPRRRGDGGEGSVGAERTGRLRLGGPRAWLAPAALALAGLVSAGTAFALDADAASSAVGDGEAATAAPVLSARRVPELLADPVAERRLGVDLEAWLQRSPADTCLVVEDQGEPVFAHNATTPLTGASTQKLLTATALLLALGPEGRLETTAAAARAPRDGVVAGDLYLVGGGDALLGTRAWGEHLRRQPRTVDDIGRLAQAIADAGVTRVEGSVVGDATRYDGETYHPSWPRRFYDQRVVGPVSGLMVNDGYASFPSSDDPAAPTVPAEDPAADAAKVLTRSLRARGVEVVGPARSGEAPSDTTEVASLPSAPASEIAAEMLRQSDNEVAEAAVKEIGRVERGEGSWEAGAAAVTDLLAEAGVPLDGVMVDDGSGLSIENRLTCATLIDVLTRPETGPVIRDGLAVAGESGTLDLSWDGSAAAGRLRGKTGTLRNVTALAGEIEVRDGHTVTFAYVANVPDPAEVTSHQVGLTQLADVLMAYPRGVDVAQLEPAAALATGG